MCNNVGYSTSKRELSIAYAIDFHNKIGGKHKEERLRFLQNYWTSKVRDIKNIQLNTPADLGRSCGIANVGISKMKPAEMAKALLDKYKIWTVAIDSANVLGCRITPGIFTTTEELDKLVNALKEMSG